MNEERWKVMEMPSHTENGYYIQSTREKDKGFPMSFVWCGKDGYKMVKYKTRKGAQKICDKLNKIELDLQEHHREQRKISKFRGRSRA